MRRRAVLFAVVLLLLAAGSGLWLERIREEADIPMSAARVPLGGFEPLAVSFLWIRAEQMRAAGDLPQAVATYRLVTELSPHVAPAWVLPAHLLVWTDSGTGDPEAEWRWVREGLALLERGLELNPDDPHLLWTLGQTLYFRISENAELRTIAVRELERLPEEWAAETFARLVVLDPGDLAENMLRAATVKLEEVGSRGRDEGK